MTKELFAEKSVDTGAVTEFNYPSEKTVDPEKDTVKETFTGAMEKDVAAAKELKDLKRLIGKKEMVEKTRGNVGIDESGMNFAGDIIAAIYAAEQKIDAGEELTEEDFQRITGAYGIRDRAKELLEIRAQAKAIGDIIS